MLTLWNEMVLCQSTFLVVFHENFFVYVSFVDSQGNQQLNFQSICTNRARKNFIMLESVLSSPTSPDSSQ